MPILAAGSSIPISIGNGGSVKVVTNGGFGSVVETPVGKAATTTGFGQAPFLRVFGPYPDGARVVIANASCGVLEYDPDGATTNLGYLGIVGSRGGCFSGRLAGNFQIMGRSKHVAMDDIASLQLGYGNFYTNTPSPYEYTPGAVSSFAASIEYPVGVTLTTVTFGGATAGSVADGGLLLSDSTAVAIPKGATFYVRTFHANTAGVLCNQEYGLNNVTGAVPNSGEWVTWGATTPDLTQSLANSNNQALGRHFRPNVILGSTTRPTFFLTGDSRLGQGDNYDNTPSSFGLRGEADRSVGKRFATFNAGCPGERLSEVIVGNYSKRFQFAQYCSQVISEYGFNDIAAGTSLTTMLANLTTFAKLFGSAPFYQTTISPNSDSTDGWITLGSQTIHNAGTNTVRVNFNNAIRQGLAGPVTGGVEVADQVESARDSGLWKAGGRSVSDAAITTATATLTSATAAFVAADVGKAVYVAGAGAAGAALSTSISSVTNATTVVLGANAGTTVSGAFAGIGANTGDGIHGTSVGFALIETSTAFQGLA